MENEPSQTPDVPTGNPALHVLKLFMGLETPEESTNQDDRMDIEAEENGGDVNTEDTTDSS